MDLRFVTVLRHLTHLHTGAVEPDLREFPESGKSVSAIIISSESESVPLLASNSIAAATET